MSMESRPDESTTVSRRSLLHRSAAAGLGIALFGAVDSVFGAGSARAAGALGYGALAADPAMLLALPPGFRYGIVAEAGVTRLESGEPTPSDPDGTASFAHRGGSALVNNHEIDGTEPHPVPRLPGLTYDHAAGGGTTTIEVDGNGRRIGEYVSLAGTHNNCAGGRTPWNTWLSCEETEVVLDKPHGYVFEVDPYDRAANLAPHPIKALGRYSHEAVAVDPLNGTLYLTEDAGNPNGLLYRFTPPRAALPLRKGSLRALGPKAGRLDALAAYTRDGALVPDLSVATRPGTTYAARWVPVPDRDATTTPVRKQFADSEITRSHKLEGMWWGSDGAFFVASFARGSDGSAAAHDGQVWFLDPYAGTIELTLRFAYTADQDSDADGPDNITVSPYGGVIMAEDGEGASHLLGATPDGRTYVLARNELNDSEFTGPNFSYDRCILFANIQTPGHVLAIRGPFAHLNRG